MRGALCIVCGGLSLATFACGDDSDPTVSDATTTTSVGPAGSSTTPSLDSSRPVTPSPGDSSGGPPATTGDPACPNLLSDGGFEDGLRGAWSTDSVLFSTPLCDDICGKTNAAYAGEWWVWFGGEPDGESAHVSQSIVIPEGDASLSFYLRIPEAAGTGNDILVVLIDGTSMLWISDLDVEQYADYTQVWFDLTEIGDGLEHEIELAANFPGTGTSSFYIDSVSVTPCAAPH